MVFSGGGGIIITAQHHGSKETSESKQQAEVVHFCSQYVNIVRLRNFTFRHNNNKAGVIRLCMFYNIHPIFFELTLENLHILYTKRNSLPYIIILLKKVRKKMSKRRHKT